MLYIHSNHKSSLYTQKTEKLLQTSTRDYDSLSDTTIRIEMVQELECCTIILKNHLINMKSRNAVAPVIITASSSEIRGRNWHLDHRTWWSDVLRWNDTALPKNVINFSSADWNVELNCAGSVRPACWVASGTGVGDSSTQKGAEIVQFSKFKLISGHASWIWLPERGHPCLSSHARVSHFTEAWVIFLQKTLC